MTEHRFKPSPTPLFHLLCQFSGVVMAFSQLQWHFSGIREDQNARETLLDKYWKNVGGRFTHFSRIHV